MTWTSANTTEPREFGNPAHARSRAGLLRFDAGSLDDAAPFVRFGLDVGREFIRCAGDDFHAFRYHPLLQLGRAQAARDFLCSGIGCRRSRQARERLSRDGIGLPAFPVRVGFVQAPVAKDALGHTCLRGRHACYPGPLVRAGRAQGAQERRLPLSDDSRKFAHFVSFQWPARSDGFCSPPHA